MDRFGSSQSRRRSLALALVVVGVLGLLVLPGAFPERTTAAATSGGVSALEGPTSERATAPAAAPRPLVSAPLYAPAYESRQIDLLSGASLAPGTPVTEDLGPSYGGPGFVAYDPLSHDVIVLGQSSIGWFNATTDHVDRWSSLLERGGPRSVAATNLPPYEAAVDTTDGLVYVTHARFSPGSCNGLCAGDYVTVVNDSTGAIVGSVGGGEELSGIAFDAANDRVYVADTYASRVEVLDGRTASVLGYLPTGSQPENLAVDTGNGELYVANGGTANLTELNLTNGTVTATIPLRVISGAFDIVLDTVDQRLFVDASNGALAEVNVSNNRERYATSAGGAPWFLSWDPLNDTIEVGEAYGRSLGVVNASSAGRPTAQYVGLSDWGGGVAYDPADRSVFASTYGYCGLTRLNATSQAIVSVTPVSAQVSTVAFDPSNAKLFVGDTLGPNFWVENASSSTALPVVREFRTNSMVYDPTDGVVLTEGPISGTVGKLYASNDSLGPNITTVYGYQGSALGWDPSADTVWVWAGCGGTYCSSSLDEYDVGNGTYVGSAAAAEYESGIAVDPVHHRLFYDGSTWSVYGGTSLVVAVNTSNRSHVWSTVSPGNPVGLAYDPLAGSLWVEDQANNKLTTYNATTGNVTGNVSWAYPGSISWLPPIVYDAAAHAMFASTAYYTNTSVTTVLLEYNATTAAYLGSVPIDGFPTGFGVDPTNGTLYASTNGVTVDEIVLGRALHVSTFAASPSLVDDGGATVLAVNASGGASGPFTYAYAGLPSGCASANVSSLNCTPTATGSYLVTVNVTDANGTVARSSLTIVVLPALRVGLLTVAASEIRLGGTANFSANFSGGIGGYAFKWNGLPPGCPQGVASPLVCVPTRGGAFNVSLSVEDAAGAVASTGAVALLVRAPIHAHLFESRGAVDIGEGFNLTGVVANATSSDTYVWGGLPGGCASQNATSLACAPNGSGTFLVNLTVRDPFLGATSSNVVTVVVDPALSALTVQLSSALVDVGQSVTFWANVSGGSSAYTVQWFGVPTTCPSSQGSPLTCRLAAAGTYAVWAMVNDSLGSVRNGSAPLLTVDARPAITALAASRSTLDVGQSVWFNATGTAPAGGATWRWSGLPGGCLSANVADLLCAPNASGPFDVVANLTDGSGAGSLAAPVVPVLIFPPLGVAESIPVPASVVVGTSLAFAASVSGGSGGLTYAWTLPSGCSAPDAPNATCVVTSVGNDTVTVTVNDSDGARATSVPIGFEVLGGGLVATAVGADRATVDVGTALTLYANVSGGVAPYTYQWSGLPTGCSAANATPLTCRPGQVGSFAVAAEVVDARGATVGLAPTTVDVVAAPSVAIGLSSGGPNVSEGSTVNLTSTVGGGVGPFVVRWSMNGASVGTGANVSVAVPRAGSYQFVASVTDALEVTNSSNSVTVVAASTTAPVATGGSSTPSWTGLVLGVVVGAAVGAAVAILLRRRAPPAP